MRHHVDHRARLTRTREDENAKRDEPEVRHRGVGEQAPHVLGGEGYVRSVEDADQGHADDDRCVELTGCREDRQAVADHSESSHLVENTDQ